MKLYHGSSKQINGLLKPILISSKSDYIHKKAAVFGTERQDIAALFMFPEEFLASIGFEGDVAFICIWGLQDFKGKDLKGYLYVLPGESFEKIGKDYEWQSYKEVEPIEVKEYQDSILGMMELGVQVYFIQDEKIMDKIVENVGNRSNILKGLVSENQKQGKNIKLLV